MLTRIVDAVERAVSWALAALFAALICVVALQVLARNVFEMPMIWTLDLAQLLFSWCIFVGAAVAWRRGAHYEVNLWPGSGPAAAVPRVASVIAAAAVIAVLLVHGVRMTRIATVRESQSLGISELWFFLPIPLGAALMALFLVERLARGRRAAA